MELPEIIWKQLEAGNICHAAQIQQLGFHLHTGLSVESGIGGSEANVQKWFPVINQQKVSLVAFNEIIIKESTNRLQDIQLTLEVWPKKIFLLIVCIKKIFFLQNAADSCCALMLFRGGSSTEILSDFLKFRSEAASHIVPQNGIKQQLQSFLQFIISSFAAFHALFVGKIDFLFMSTDSIIIPYYWRFQEGFPDSTLPQGMLSEKLRSMCQSNAVSTVHLLSLTPGFVRQLPPIVTEFR